tara:strand:- start:6355 stop:7137 length:783 start_codon:yes stop_codon:yes gene_type:complete
MNERLAVCVVANFNFLKKYFNGFKNDLRVNGNFRGEILIVTDFITPTFLFPKILFDSKVKVKRFKRIKFSEDTKHSLRNLNTNNQPNRHINKPFQWHKIHLFSNKLKQWNHIFYMDINMKIHHDINVILQNKPEFKLQARADGYPDFQWTLSSQFDKSAENFTFLKKKFNLEINNYFQTGIMFFDTLIINENTKKEIINLVEDYPISITNEQGILNLYFIFIKNIYEDLPVNTNDGIVYYYWLVENQKIHITKQNRTKNK